MDHGNRALARPPAELSPDDAARLVLGDEMLAAGDPLGELVAVQAGLAKDRDDHELLARQRQLLREHEATWLGRHAPALRREGRVDYHWHLGFLDGVVLRTTDPDEQRDLTTSPAARFLRRVVVDTRDCDPDGPPIHARLDGIVAPYLEELEYRPNQRTLRPLRNVAQRAWPRLQRLTLWLGDDGEHEDLAAVLLAFPRLDTLTVRGATNRVWSTLARSPVLSRLKSLDLAHGMLDGLRDVERFTHLERIAMSDNRLDDATIASLSRRFGARAELEPQAKTG